MRHLLFRSLAALACFGVFSLAQTCAAPKPDQSDKPDFNGTWTLDLKGDARATVETLRGMRVAHYYGIDLSSAALELASKALAPFSFLSAVQVAA